MNRLLPPACVLCGAHGKSAQNICAPCEQALPILPQHCPQCAQFLTFSTDEALRCGACLHSPPPFDRTFALFPYAPPIVQLIVKLKFQGQLSHAKLFGHLMCRAIQHQWYHQQTLPDVLIPVPLHPLRLQERGFNQALEIARTIGKTLELPIDFNGIQRIKPTCAQSGLPALERKLNMAQAFALNTKVTGLHIAVIDDVITTGHTMRELAHVLKMNGARQVDVWCCARRG